MGMPGGKSEAREPSEDVLAVVGQLKENILQELPQELRDNSEFVPVASKTQVVAGLNYFVKIRISAQDFIHVTIWKRLGDLPPQLTAVHTNQTLESPL